MDEEDLPRPGDPLEAVMKTDLDPFSVHELEARVRMLEAETERTRAKLAGAKDFRSAADSLFKS
ncbi:hypothetical protein B5C34_06145 [Pacificimonas flava]|uniref:DUF1192 domain-containing protein n=2 Tax=Pacificimonas TaxID=1960290 RepID=A0A219B4J0_9SPHN|nr:MULTISPECIES: DUF1192 domain-containing protein [Pacificimonas]MBZ6377194.1 DUF1192 domain-containing protein [Pacificimonas aurantium]OWV33084.1 hypothetical protein B5C34_06145 [Pacificimonas flava]